MYPDEVITISKKGKKEVRNYVSHGTFVKYEYLNTVTGKVVNSKRKLVLRLHDGRVEEYFLISIKNEKYLLTPTTPKGKRAIWVKDHPVDLDHLLECQKI